MSVVSSVPSIPAWVVVTAAGTLTARSANCGAYTVGGMRCDARAACAGSTATMATAMPVAMAAAMAASLLASMDLSFRSLPSRFRRTPMASSRE